MARANEQTLSLRFQGLKNNQNPALKKKNKNKNKNKRNNNSNNAIFGRITNVPVSSSRPVVSRNPRGMAGITRISHVELVSPLIAYFPGFNLVKRLRLNPGSKSTFNWLSTLAPNFEFYRFTKLVFHYEARCATSTNGSVIMSPEYDATEGDYTRTEQNLFSNKGTKDDSIWKTMTVAMEPKNMNRMYKAHTNMSDERFATTKQDLKTVDVGQLFVALDTDITNPYTFGKLFVDYTVELFTPQAPTEPLNKGGAQFNLVNPTKTSQAPISAKATVNVITQDLSPIFAETALNSSTVYPTAMLGRLAQDWKGIVSTRAYGTNFDISPTNMPDYYVSKSPGAVLPEDIKQKVVAGLANTDKSMYFGSTEIEAVAGDYIKILTKASDTLTQINSVFGAFGNVASIL